MEFHTELLYRFVSPVRVATNSKSSHSTCNMDNFTNSLLESNARQFVTTNSVLLVCSSGLIRLYVEKFRFLP